MRKKAFYLYCCLLSLFILALGIGMEVSKVVPYLNKYGIPRSGSGQRVVGVLFAVAGLSGLIVSANGLRQRGPKIGPAHTHLKTNSCLRLLHRHANGAAL